MWKRCERDVIQGVTHCVSSLNILTSRTSISHEKIRAIGYKHSENMISLCLQEKLTEFAIIMGETKRHGGGFAWMTITRIGISVM